MKLKTIAPALLMTTLPVNGTTCPKNIPLTIKKPKFEINLLDSFCKQKDDSLFNSNFISQQNDSLKTPFENIDLSMFELWCPEKNWQELMKISVEELYNA